MPKPPSPQDDPLEALAERLQRWLDQPGWTRAAEALTAARARVWNLIVLGLLILSCLLRMDDSSLFLLFLLLLAGTAVGVWRGLALAHIANVVLSVIASVGAPFLLVLGKLYTDRGAETAQSGGGSVLFLVLLLASNALCSLVFLWRNRYQH